MNVEWFSAMLRFVILIEGEGGERLSRSVILIRARTWEDARNQALVTGRRMERAYVGGTGLGVRLKLDVIETLDHLGEEIVDGREVYSEPLDLPPGVTYAYGAEFHPEDSRPEQTGV